MAEGLRDVERLAVGLDGSLCGELLTAAVTSGISLNLLFGAGTNGVNDGAPGEEAVLLKGGLEAGLL